MLEQPKGPGRPSQGKMHIDMTLSKDVIEFLRSMRPGDRSRFVENWIKQHSGYIEWRAKHDSSSHDSSSKDS